MKSKFIAKKSLGQHFLRSEKAIKQIVESIDKNFDKKNPVFEIGPGEGVLTTKLLEANYKITAIEIDKRSIETLEKDLRNYIENEQLEIVEKDCLDMSYSPKDYILLGNIPYYITGAIFRHTFEQKNLPKQVIFLIQKEVAVRILAKKNSDKKENKETILSISIKIFTKNENDIEIVDYVKAGSFAPPPKVDSAILSVKNIVSPFGENREEKQKIFFEILRAAFSQKRKFLISNLKNKLSEGDYKKYENVFQEIFINKYSQKVRAEDINLEDWKLLIKKL